MATITRFEEIEAWQTARKLAQLIYRLSQQGDFGRDFGLRDQIRRASVSVMSNIAEGFESQSQAMFVSYLYRAKGSAGEVRSQLYLALDLRYISPAQFDEAYNLAEKASCQVSRFIAYLKAHPKPRTLREQGAEYHVEAQ